MDLLREIANNNYDKYDNATKIHVLTGNNISYSRNRVTDSRLRVR